MIPTGATSAGRTRTARDITSDGVGNIVRGVGGRSDAVSALHITMLPDTMDFNTLMS